MAQPLSRKVAAVQIRQELLRRGWRVGDLARMLNLTSDHISNVVSGNNQSRRARTAIENALGIPIWSKPEEFYARQKPSKPSPSTPNQS